MPKIVDHAQYRHQLLSQSFALFAKKGYAALTMRQIANELGVSTGTLYHYFPSKEALFEQLLDELDQHSVNQALAAIESATTLKERIEIAFDLIAQNEDLYMQQTLILIEFYQQKGRGEAAQSEALRRIWERVRDAVGLTIGVQNESLVTMLGCLIDGILLNRYFGLFPISYADQAEIVTKMLTLYLEQFPESV